MLDGGRQQSTGNALVIVFYSPRLNRPMPKIKLSRREWMLFLFPCALLLLTHLDKFRAMDGSRLGMALNPFARARENARKMSCQSNLKQLGLGMMQYVQDYDGRFPINTSATINWPHTLQPYVKSCPILHCPSDPSGFGAMVPSYWMNANLDEKSGRGATLKSVDRPARTFLFGENDALPSKSPFTLSAKGWNAKSSYAGRHLWGANYAFVDGHVKWFAVEDIKAFQFKLPCCTTHSWKLKVLK